MNDNAGSETGNLNAVPDSSLLHGKALASQFCQSCHLLPDPSMLDKANWNIILPKMGLRLGIKSHNGVNYENPDKVIAAEERSLIPAYPAMNAQKWQNILDYYVVTAPDALNPQNKNSIKSHLASFSVHSVPNFLYRKNLMASYLKIDNSVKPGRLFVFETYSKQLFLLDHQLKVLDSISTDGIIVDINFQNKEILAVTMGTKLNMTDKEKTGTVFPLVIDKSGKMHVKPPVFKDLSIPVQIISADLNGDNRIDFLLCEFGFLTGALTWMENKGSGKYQRHVIRNFPGSVKAYVTKSKQGLPDLWVLFAQGEEGIFHFKNKGGGVWESSQVIRFPSLYGSTSFEMLDMNHDGFEDIVYTSGDNGDLTGILKPYHGVYIYLNDGNDKFTKSYFYPINGCYKVIAKDFGNSGNIDLAIIAFFTDETKPEESFVFLKNEGDLNFTPYVLSPEYSLESILTMDSGDLNDDGRTDLILGNAFPFPGKPGYNKTEPLFIILNNIK